jgi:phosphate transport system substrate-binding protein
MFKKIITAAASAAVVAGVLLAAPANAAGTAIVGGGSSFANGAIVACKGAYATTANVTYNKSDSGTGRTNYANGTADFAATDGTFASTDLPGDPKALTWASGRTNFVTVPLLGGPVVFAYSATGVSDGLKLTPAVISGIFKGTITRWDDAALKALNPKAKLPKKAIKVAYRNSGSGTTANLTNYLYQTVNTAATGETNNSGWKANSKDLVDAAGGSSTVVSGLQVAGSGFAPVSSSFATSQLLAAYIEDNSNAFGYFDLSDSMTMNDNQGADVGIAALQNKAGAFVMPTVSAAAKFLGAQSASTDTSNRLNGTLVIDFTKNVAGAYQLSIVTYGVAHKYTSGTKTAENLQVQDFFNYVVKTCIPAKAASLGYVALGGALKTSALAQIKLIG